MSASAIKECKQDMENLKLIDQSLQKIIKTIAEKGAMIESRHQQSDDQELGEIAERYKSLCFEAKEVRKHTSLFSPLYGILQSRLRRLKAARPGFFEKIFQRKRLKAAKRQLQAAKVSA